MPLRISILYIEEELAEVSEVANALKESGDIFVVQHVAEWKDASDRIEAGEFDVAIFGIHDTGKSMDSMMQLHEYAPNLPILATGMELNMEIVSMTVKRGAKVYLPQPLNPRRLLAIIKKAVAESG